MLNNPAPWPSDPLAIGAGDAGGEAAERQARGKPRPGKPRRSWRSFLSGVAIGSTAMAAGLVALMASGVLTAVATPEAEGPDLDAAAVTPGLALLNWNGAMAAEHPVTSLQADPLLLLRSVAAAEGSDGPRQVAQLVSAEVGRVWEAVDDLSLLTSAAILQDAVRGSNPFMAELALALQAAGDDAELLQPLDRLMTWAESGPRARPTSRGASMRWPSRSASPKQSQCFDAAQCHADDAGYRGLDRHRRQRDAALGGIARGRLRGARSSA